MPQEFLGGGVEETYSDSGSKGHAEVALGILAIGSQLCGVCFAVVAVHNIADQGVDVKTIFSQGAQLVVLQQLSFIPTRLHADKTVAFL